MAGGSISFSKYFWNQTLNGATVRQAFQVAAQAIDFNTDVQTPELSDDGNTTPNELLDGLVARSYSIGSGFLLAGDDPLVSGLTVNPSLDTDFEAIAVSNVTSTGIIDRVIAVVTRPDGSVVEQPLAKGVDGFGDRSFGLCAEAGDYNVAVFAFDQTGNVSLPVSANVVRTSDCTDFLFQTGFE